MDISPNHTIVSKVTSTTNTFPPVLMAVIAPCPHKVYRSTYLPSIIPANRKEANKLLWVFSEFWRIQV
ncbi:MAG: hypothetical protein DWI24_11625 [Planctomycetota bacterium]|nr:MAG: hypothetical protein DWI24_11625 [Planctomycetota bacterium]